MLVNGHRVPSNVMRLLNTVGYPRGAAMRAPRTVANLMEQGRVDYTSILRAAEWHAVEGVRTDGVEDGLHLVERLTDRGYSHGLMKILQISINREGYKIIDAMPNQLLVATSERHDTSLRLSMVLHEVSPDGDVEPWLSLMTDNLVTAEIRRTTTVDDRTWHRGQLLSTDDIRAILKRYPKTATLDFRVTVTRLGRACLPV